MRLPGVSLALLCCAGVCAAQNPPAATAEVTQHEAPATFTSKSNLVEVPVVVRDKQGHPIGNLTKDDFFLFDKGKPQLISKFTVEKAGTPYIPAVSATLARGSEVPSVSPFDETAQGTPPIPERFIAYLVDDVHLSVGDLGYLRKALTDHIAQSLNPVTRVAIVTTSGLGALDFTDDRDKIFATLNRIQPYVRTPTSSSDCTNISFYMADLIVNKQDPSAIALATADAQTCALSTTTAQAMAAMVQSSAVTALVIGEGESDRAMEALKNIATRLSAMPGSRTMVLVSPGFLLPSDDQRPNLTALLERAIRSNVTINTLDARGVYALIPGGDASTRTQNTTNLTLKSSYVRAEALALEDILEELAAGTGGSYFHNDNGMVEGLDELTKQPEYIYLLGFSPSSLKYDGTYHTLKVSLKDPAMRNLQARRGYYAPKRPNDPEEAAKEDIREAVFSRDELQDIPIDMRVQFFKSSPTNARVSVISRVDVRNLHFRKDQDRSKDTLTVVAGLFDRNGNFVNGTQRIVEMNLRDQTLTALGTSGLPLRSDFDVTPGAYTIRIVVRDAEGQMMAAKNGSVRVP